MPEIKNFNIDIFATVKVEYVSWYNIKKVEKFDYKIEVTVGIFESRHEF